jgi:hypothetical protein
LTLNCAGIIPDPGHFSSATHGPGEAEGDGIIASLDDLFYSLRSDVDLAGLLAELADALDSKSSARKGVSVQLR